MILFRRRTKILATLGPATDDPKVLTEMVKAGVDVVRINFSHGQVADHARRVGMIREAAARAGRYVGILGDLQGPKIRIDRFVRGKVDLIEGASFVLDASLDADAGTETSVGITYKALPADVQIDDVLLLNDGQISLQVVRVEGTRVFTVVLVGGGAERGEYLGAAAKQDHAARCSRISTAGSFLPSTNSKKAPPPVEM